MKKIIFIVLLAALFSCKTTQSVGSQGGNENQIVNDTIYLSNLMNNNTNMKSLPPQEKLNIIYYILQNTKEISIHQMRGETNNIVMINEDGREAVYDENGDSVTNDYNKGSFNYFDYKVEPIKKFIGDILPWLKWGNDPADPTSEMERFYYYTLDLNLGIQKYIFEGRKTELKNVEIDLLSEDEKNIYKLFDYIIFNESYHIEFTDKNMDKFESDGSYYWNYFYQIHDLFGIIQN